jgi:hypothetical protein
MEGNILQDKIKVSLPKGKKKIALVDTEQSVYDVSMVMKRVYKTCRHRRSEQQF